MDDGVSEIQELVFSNEHDDHHVASKKQKVEVKQSHKTEEGEECSNGVGGGVMSNFISVFGLSKENKQEEAEINNGVEEETKIQAAEEEEEEKEGGGILKGLISNLVSPRAKTHQENNHSSVFAEGDGVEEEQQQEKKNSGGIFNNLISGILHHQPNNDAAPEQEQEEHQPQDKLRAPVPDMLAPSSEEASILIHSLVHD